VVADDLVRLLELHHQRLAALAGRDVEPVDGEIIRLDADMAVLEGAEPGETAAPSEQPVDATRAKAFARCSIVVSSAAPSIALWQARDQRFQRVLRRVEQEIRLVRIVDRLGAAVEHLQQIGGEREGRDIGRRIDQRLEPHRVVALQRRDRLRACRLSSSVCRAKTSATASATAMPRRVR
jgi:hypothetical protein